MYLMIQSCFAQLDQYQPGLSTAVERYITQGDDQVLVQLAQLTPQQFKKANIALLQDLDGRQVSKNSYDAFKRLYRSKLLAKHEMAKRLAIVMAQCADLSNIYNAFGTFSPNVGDWLKVLLHEVTIAFHASQEKDIPTHFNSQWWLSLMQDSEISAENWLTLLLELGTRYWGGSVLRSIIKSFNWLVVLQQINALEVVGKLEYTTKLALINCLNPYPCLNEILPCVVLLATDNRKQVREDAAKLLAKLDPQSLCSYLDSHYHSFSTTVRKALIPYLPLVDQELATGLLQQWLKNEDSKAVRELIQNTLANQQAVQSTKQAELIIPPFIPLEDDAPIPIDWLDKLMVQHAKIVEKLRLDAAQEKQSNLAGEHKATWRQTKLNDWQNYDITQVQQDLQKLAGMQERCFSPLFKELWQGAELHLEAECKLIHLVRLDSFNGWWGKYKPWLKHHSGVLTDIRQLAQLLQQENKTLRGIAEWILLAHWGTKYTLPNTFGIEIWPFFAEHDEYLREAFALESCQGNNPFYQFELAHGMLVLALFPVIPDCYLHILYQYALSANKTYGPLARRILTDYGICADRVIAALGASQLDERIVAANWIAELNLTQAITPLKQALQNEKKETAIAVFLSSMHKLGVDISTYLSPQKLLDEAMQGLSKAMPSGLAWFPFHTLPTMYWQDGQPVAAEVIKWWLVLACKLKQPEGNPLLNLYMQQLQTNSLKQLGLVILQLFIQQDTINLTDETAHTYAQQNQQALFSEWQALAQEDWGTAYRGKTMADAYQELFKRKKSEYLGTAVGEKGILALSSYADAASAVQLLSRYMKDHYTRRAQIEAMLSALANNNDPVIIQLLLSLARRYRTRSIQEKAALLVNEIAERNHWTHDELADRTIPTAGFENNGQQVLQYGSRNLTLRLDRELKIILENEEGKVLKALPAPRQNDDAESVKQAKADFSNSKKELQQVLKLQTARLYEAMCTNRLWKGSEWREYLLEHPIMNRLLQQLVWQIQEGEQRYWMRPTAELELIDLDDDEHELKDDATICIAHISQMPADQAQAWRKHFKTEKVTPLFEQFNQPKHALSDEERKGKQLDYHKGWLTDAFTLRGILTKRGYQRGTAEDGGFFSHYFKDFTSVKLRLIIEFSGNCLPEENNPAALFHLAFVSPDQSGWIAEDSYLPLANIPENLLNEAMLDYESIAAKGSFDADWQKKIPW